MRKVTKIILAIILAVATCFCMACTPNPFEGKYTIVINANGNDSVYAIDSEAQGVYTLADALLYLRDNEGVVYEYSDSTYGVYISRLGDICPVGYSQWVSVYTSVESDKDVSEHAESIQYEGHTLYSSGFGVSSMSLEEGCIIYFTLGIYNG